MPDNESTLHDRKNEKRIQTSNADESFRNSGDISSSPQLKYDMAHIKKPCAEANMHVISAGTGESTAEISTSKSKAQIIKRTAGFKLSIDIITADEAAFNAKSNSAPSIKETKKMTIFASKARVCVLFLRKDIVSISSPVEPALLRNNLWIYIISV